MAQQDLTEIAEQIIAAGGTREQLLALTDVAEVGGTIIAWNRRAEAAAYELLDRVSRASQRAAAPARPAGEPMATDRQVSYAWSLICQRIRGGRAMYEGGFISGDYPTQDELRRMTRRSISALIDSLRESY